MVTVLALALGFSLIDPIYPRDQLLHHAPMTLILPFLFWASWKGWLSTAAIACVIAFMGLHVYGARFVYSEVPGGESLTWLALGEVESDRNHFDRLVHLAFGVLFMCPLAEVCQRYGSMRRGWARAFALLAILGISALYEVFEWLLTVIVDPAHADRYNGQQGDSWDAQKDMALAFLGAAAVIFLVGTRAPRPSSVTGGRIEGL